MAKCEQGYLCDVCGKEVENLTESDLYLRFVLGEIPLDLLHVSSERHIRCNPALAQFIIDGTFLPAVSCSGEFARNNFDPVWVAEEDRRVTRAWKRLQELPLLGLPIREYPLLEVLQKSPKKAGHES